MANILHTSGILEYYEKEYDYPDIKGEIVDRLHSIEASVSGIEYGTEPEDESALDTAKNDIQKEIDSLTYYARGSEVSGYHEYVTNLENLLKEATDVLLTTIMKADNLRQEILCLDNVKNRSEIADDLYYLTGEADRFLNCDTSLRHTLEKRAWSKSQRDFVFKILPGKELQRLELLPFRSRSDNLVVGVDNWISLEDKTLMIFSGNHSLTIKAVYGDIIVNAYIGGNESVFKLSEMKDYFLDILEPSEEEILMYEMAHGSRYDIYTWKNIFGNN